MKENTELLELPHEHNYFEVRSLQEDPLWASRLHTRVSEDSVLVGTQGYLGIIGRMISAPVDDAAPIFRNSRIGQHITSASCP